MHTPQVSGSEVPGYEIAGLVVETRHNLIYRATRLEDGTAAILKILNRPFPTLQELATLRLEHYILADLEPVPGVPRVFDLVEHERQLILAMSDMGVPLESFFQDGIPALEEFLEIALQIARILSGIHGREVYHRDVKPSNIMVDPATGTAGLIDFGLASRRRRDEQDAVSPNMLVGSLPYLSPEQTGRMNRSVDYRTDFYSLGVTFYKMLTGQLPFTSTDAMALVHDHLATEPAPPQELNPAIPGVLAEIVLKLMAKHPSDRYQSAAGLIADLERVAGEHRRGRGIETFPLGGRDTPLRFELPTKLYGRARELERLMAEFDRSAAGEIRILLVAGYSGIGKTSLVHELHKPIAGRRGYFTFTKFDQYQRNISYEALGQAFGGLIRQILTGSEDEVESFRNSILAALSSMGGLIIETVPELELLIGKQPTVLPLSGAEAQHRFVDLFERFLGVLATAEHPLVFFLDDLQWVDQATLDFLLLLIKRNKPLHLLLLGAYRDNEVTPAHPLILALEKIREEKEVTEIQLQPLDLIDTNDFIADVLYREPESTLDLSRLIHARTDGNPFFLSQSLTALYEASHLTFDHSTLHWQWNLDEIRRMDASLNVVELMIAKVRGLPGETRDVLKLAACLGNRFDLQTLAAIHGENARITSRHLWPAVDQEFVISLNDDYRFYQTGTDDEQPPVPPEAIRFKFLHDRVQEAIYSQIPAGVQQTNHLEIGRVLLRLSTEAGQGDERIFDIVNHYRRGSPLIENQAERDHLAELCLAAGGKARAAAAYPAAREYFGAGLEFLEKGDDPWASHYQTMLQLSRYRCECEFLCLDAATGDEIFRQTLPLVKSTLDKASFYDIILAVYPTLGRFVEATRLGQECLRLFGIDLPEDPEEVKRALREIHEKIESKVAGVDIASLRDAPAVEDPELVTVQAILHRIFAAAYCAEEVYDVGDLAALEIMVLSLDHGHCEYSAFGYNIYGTLLSAHQQDYDRAFAFGQLALSLNQRFGTPPMILRVNNMFAHAISHYKRHLRENIPLYTESYKAAIQCGDIWWGVWAVHYLLLCRFIMGDHLSEVYANGTVYEDYVKSTGNETLLLLFQYDQHLLLNLMGRTSGPESLDSDVFDEAGMLERLEADAFEFTLFWYYLYRSFLCYLYGDHERALSYGREADSRQGSLPGFPVVPDHVFIHALVLAASAERAGQDARLEMLQQVDEAIERMEVWARHSPANYRHRYFLMLAERVRVGGEVTRTMKFYDQAIAEARRSGYLHHVALANELAARFYLGLGHTKIAWIYMFDAVQSYVAWGAQNKVDQLQEEFRDLMATHALYSHLGQKLELELEPTRSHTAHRGDFDLEALLRASRVLATEKDLDELLEDFLEISMQYMGAHRAFLIFPSSDALVIEGEGSIQAGELEIEVLRSIALDDHEGLPKQVIRYVARSGEELVIADAGEHDLFAQDPYVLAHRSKSMLCVPLANRGVMTAIVYMENEHVAGAFTESHLDVLRLLVGQAAVSLENALLRRQDETSGFHFQVGGSLPEDSPSYVRRQADRDLYRAVKSGEFCFVLNARQMGKSSLRVHTMRRLQREGFACVSIDITSIGSRQVTTEQWYAGVARKLIAGLGLDRELPLRTWWREHRDLSPVQRFSELIETSLGLLDPPIVIFIDEIDSVRSLNFNLDDFFAAIRACYNQRADDSRYERLTFVLLGVARPSELIEDSKRTPFNIGRSIPLSGFRLAEAKPLLRGLAVKGERPEVLLKEVLAWTHGQPFLTQRVCRIVLEAESTPITGREAEWVQKQVVRKVIQNWELQDEPEHLKTIRSRILGSSQGAAKLLPLYREIMTRGSVHFQDTPIQAELLLTGLVVREWNKLRISNNIYASVFNLDWIEQEMAALDAAGEPAGGTAL